MILCICTSDRFWLPITTCRSNLQRSSRRFRQIISSSDFEALFGPATPHPDGGRQNIFGAEDELRVAPKGVDKTHKYDSVVVICMGLVDNRTDVEQKGHRHTEVSIVRCCVQVRQQHSSFSTEVIAIDVRHGLGRFTDKQVLSPDFKRELAGVAKVVRPFVHW